MTPPNVPPTPTPNAPREVTDEMLVDRLVDAARADGVEAHCNANTKATGLAFVSAYADVLSRLGFLRCACDPNAAPHAPTAAQVERAAREREVRDIGRAEGALTIAAIRMEILVDRMRGCHAETGNHELLDEGEMFVAELRAVARSFAELRSAPAPVAAGGEVGR